MALPAGYVNPSHPSSAAGAVGGLPPVPCGDGPSLGGGEGAGRHHEGPSGSQRWLATTPRACRRSISDRS